MLEAEAAALRRKCDDQAHDLSDARETGALAAQGSDARIAQLERELAAARARNEEAARAHAADASSQNDAARKAVEELTATFESQRQHLVDARTQAEAPLALAFARPDASAAAIAASGLLELSARAGNASYRDAAVTLVGTLASNARYLAPASRSPAVLASLASGWPMRRLWTAMAILACIARTAGAQLGVARRLPPAAARLAVPHGRHAATTPTMAVAAPEAPCSRPGRATSLARPSRAGSAHASCALAYVARTHPPTAAMLPPYEWPRKCLGNLPHCTNYSSPLDA